MNIIFTGDILRPNNKLESATTTDILWFYNLFEPFIKKVTNIDGTVLLWDNNCFDAKKFYELNNTKFDNQTDWATLYHEKNITTEAQEYLISFFKDSFIIGYELSNIIMNCFTQNAIPYINITLHPARFLDDVFFMFCTNVEKIYNKLTKYNLDENILYLY